VTDNAPSSVGLVAKLFADGPHVFVPSVDAVALEKALSEAGFPYLIYSSSTAALTDDQGNFQALADLVGPPTCPAVFVACTKRGEIEIESFASWWSGYASQKPPQLIMAGSTGKRPRSAFLALEINKAVLLLFRANQAKTAQKLVDLHEQVMMLRCEVERFQRISDDYRKELTDRAPRCVVTLEPSGTVFDPQAFNQWECKFPFEVWGLARIDVYFECNRGTIRGSPIGSICVRAFGIEDDCNLGAWILNYRDVSTGWCSLSFPNVLSTINCYLKLTLEWRTIRGPAPCLAISSNEIQMTGQSTFDGDSNYTAIPAIRLWTNLPGMPQRVRGWIG
jgi:hypothetical protein